VANYNVVDVGELDAEGPGGMVRKVRRALDAKAFGLNYFAISSSRRIRSAESTITATRTTRRSTSS
jgi:hypothetical protein